MLEKCPKCGADIVYAHGYSYYLRCKKSYSCWHISCDETTAKQYPEYISPKEEEQALDMREKLLDDNCDYFSEDSNW